MLYAGSGSGSRNKKMHSRFQFLVLVSNQNLTFCVDCQDFLGLRSDTQPFAVLVPVL